MSLLQFNNRLLHHSQIADSLRSGVAEWLKWERDLRGATFSNRIRNDPADRLPIIRLNHEMRDYIPKLSSHLSNHGQYSYILESFYLETTGSYYVDLSSQLAQSFKDDQSSFIKQAGTLIEDETQRAKDVLPASSCASVREVTLKSLLGDRLEWLAGGSLFAISRYSQG
jgi:cullin-4